MLKKFIVIGLILAFPAALLADEGMWLPLLLQRKEADMKAKGMRISAKDIYDANNASFKDAVMLFGGGCTGEFVSEKGLVLTNHHCGYSYIVSHSTVERDYLTNGFWSNSQAEELPCKGLSVTLLVYMEDVTAKVLKGVEPTMTEQERKAMIKKNIDEVEMAAVKGTHYNASIEPFYYGNQYFMYVNEIFTDVRLVGAPPSNIGKFGGDTDNWMYPRHTGDFSVFRVYADKDNKPAAYSKDNVPYKPKKHLNISLKGVKEGDFTFVFGYPGTTQQFLTSYAVNQIQNYEDPARIKLRTARLDIYNAAMNQSPEQRLRYASQVAGIANGWKKWQGEVKGLKRLDAINRKKEFEKNFTIWANVIEQRKEKYGGLLADFEKTYNEMMYDNSEYLYLTEALLTSDFMKNTRALVSLIEEKDSAKYKKNIDIFYNNLTHYFNNDYERHRKVDKAIFINAMAIFYNDFGKGYYDSWKQWVDKDFKGDINKMLDYVYEQSYITNPKKALEMLDKYKDPNKDRKKLSISPATTLYVPLMTKFNNDEKRKNYAALNSKLDSLYRIYVEGIMESNSGKDFYPDANLTLRVTYGNVKSFNPRNGVTYLPYTTIDGIMQKENPDIYDYVVEPRLKELYNKKDYGRYANEKGELPVTFIASNHTTGGNSGSPVMDADGNLIGLNFDRNWEGTMSDIMYDPDYCRNISLDIRYCLFIIDKFAGATRLIDEMTIVK
ncbi:MAG: S46 family peptidase [Bacteroidales bacterium]|jgi:V8-like Glu-specific endopeptidase|nr:S46 family peptidase [Bacteroidales bacterium]